MDSVADRLDQWRRDAFAYSSSSDRIGVVISRAIEMLMVIVKHGEGAENLQFAVDALKWERGGAMDPIRDGEGTLRKHVYRLCQALELTMESVIEGREQMRGALTAKRPTLNPNLLDESPATIEATLDSPLRDIQQKESTAHIEDMSLFKDEPEDREFEFLHESALWKEEEGIVESIDEETVEEEKILPRFQDAVEEQQTSSAVSIKPPASDTDDPNKCNLCGVRFVRKRDLKRHLATIDHTKKQRVRLFNPLRERHYKCDRCEVAFTRIDNLNRHIMSIHSGCSRRVKCPHCDLELASDLNCHLRDVHRIDPYACSKCGQSFPRVVELKEHQSTCLWTPSN